MHGALFHKLSSSLKAIDLKKDLCMNMPLTLSFIAMEQKFRSSTTEEKDAQIVAEAFKVQGNYYLLFVLRHT
jgi:hypothetical protein